MFVRLRTCSIVVSRYMNVFAIPEPWVAIKVLSYQMSRPQIIESEGVRSKPRNRQRGVAFVQTTVVQEPRLRLLSGEGRDGDESIVGWENSLNEKYINLGKYLKCLDLHALGNTQFLLNSNDPILKFSIP